MRRKEQEIADRSLLEAILQQARVCHIAMAVDNEPYVVPISFGYHDGCLYLHSAPEGRKIDLLRRNNRVCFEIDLDEGLVAEGPPCAWSIRYRSVIGTGRAYFIEDQKEKRKALDIIVAHYGEPGAYAEQSLAQVAVIRIEIDEMTGKQSGY